MAKITLAGDHEPPIRGFIRSTLAHDAIAWVR